MRKSHYHSISMILCYYIPLISDSLKVIIFVLVLHSAFHSIINFGGWISGLLSGGICPALVSLINIPKPCLSVYIQTFEILYIVNMNIQNYKLRMLANINTPILSLSLTL